MIAKKKIFTLGLVMLVAFFVVLFVFFSPVFKGKNGLDYLDDLYNSISKGSAYYIPASKAEADKFSGNSIEVNLELKTEGRAKQTALLFTQSGSTAEASGAKLKVSGDLGKILNNCLEDSDKMYVNDGQSVSTKYGYNEKNVLFNWWNALSEMDKDLAKQKKFREAKVVSMVKSKAVEPSYNYYKVEPQKIGKRMGVVIFSLAFYVIYTIWYGFAIMFLFEGWGLKLEH
ncbi:MAG: hypothetical protein A2V65_01880 [Deltaproteobacteria bacterium RBG_13_49_15]|nr:MAG: hypothetical protein A2V65_01880 [Deltaproteobacteria bacterium RBG_13_49_15]